MQPLHGRADLIANRRALDRVADIEAFSGNHPARNIIRAQQLPGCGSEHAKAESRQWTPAFSALIVIIKRRPDNRASRPPNGDSNGGTTETAFAEAEHRISITTRYPRNSATPIECFVVIAEYSPGEEAYEVVANRTRPVADRGLACFG